VKAGITLRPGTPLAMITEYLTEVDLILVMSVDPGFGGQGFIPEILDRVVDVRKSIDGTKPNHKVEISVDGGVKLFNAKEIAEKGADILVAGSAIFKSDDPISTIKQFKQLSGGINE
jgi:ribulose-phosphate 3-epimerase